MLQAYIFMIYSELKNEIKSHNFGFFFVCGEMKDKIIFTVNVEKGLKNEWY